MKYQSINLLEISFLYTILIRFTYDAVKVFFTCFFEGLHEFNTPENYAILQM